MTDGKTDNYDVLFYPNYFTNERCSGKRELECISWLVGGIWVYPFPKRQILDSSKLKEFADDKFDFDENGRKFSKWLENTVGKGEIARYEQFLLFPQCFQKTSTADT